MKQARFLSVETEGVDLILSIALEDEALGVRSLILMRTPKFEPLMPKEERGVLVTLEGETVGDMLVRVVLSSENIEIATQAEIYKIDLAKVDEEEFNSVLPLLQRMNFDNKFGITT